MQRHRSTFQAAINYLAREEGFDAPKLAPHRHQMQERLSQAGGAAVTVKPKRAEALGALGRGEGVACWAVALVERT